MDYTVLTNDTTHRAALLSALAENAGASNDFAPAAQASWEANDDQAYWVYAALTALEYSFPCSDDDNGASGTASACADRWLALATNALAAWEARWAADGATCGGGLKWQWNTAAAGYTYKNAVTNGGVFQAAARLARYTGDAAYAAWAGRVWDWSSAGTGVGLVGPAFDVYDGASDEGTQNCSVVNDDRWSYNVATYLHGAANMYAYHASGAGGNETAAGEWEARVVGLLGAANRTFFSPPTGGGNATGVMYEQECETAWAAGASCGTDQTSFKSSLARWMGKTAALVPSVKGEVTGLLEASARAAAASCAEVGGGEGQGATRLACGMRWWTAEGFDGYSDFGSMLSALEVVQSLLVTTNAPALATRESS